MTTLPPRLLRWLNPDPQETLTSFLLRLGYCNFYDPPHLIFSLWREYLQTVGISQDSANFPAHTESFRFLQTLTRSSLDTLYHLSGHRLALTLTSPDQIDIPTLILPDGRTFPRLLSTIYSNTLPTNPPVRYCPFCLAQTRAYRLAWLTPLAICLSHLTVLLDACPHCHSSLTIRAIISGQCRRCKGDLADAQVLSIADDDWGLHAQRHLHAWLGLDNLPTVASEPAFPAQSPRLLLSVFDGLHRCLQRRLFPHFLYRPPAFTHIPLVPLAPKQRVPPALHYLITATVVKSMADWPHGFYTLLEAHTLHNPDAHTKHFHTLLGNLYYLYLDKKWRHPAFSVVQAAFDEYFLTYRPHLLPRTRVQRSSYLQQHTDRIDLVNIPSAARLLGVGVETLRRLITIGALTAIQQHPDLRCSRQQVLELKYFRETYLSCVQAAHYLGWPYPLLRQLAVLGVLPTYHFPNYMERQHHMAKADLDALPQHIRDCLSPYAGPQASYTFRQAQISLKLSGGQIIQAILQRKLPAYSLPDESHLLKALRFDPADLATFRSLHR